MAVTRLVEIGTIVVASETISEAPDGDVELETEVAYRIDVE
jgi:hypothetical protein